VKVSAERIPDSQVVLEIEVESERLERSLERAYRKLVQRTHVPGFRRGKAPRPMLERYLGRHALLHEALDMLIPEVYTEALQQQDVEAIDLPRIEVVQEEPPVIKAIVAVRPTVDLGEYHSLRVPSPEVAVTGEEINGALEELGHRYALHVPVDRPVQMGDIVRADVRAVVDGRPFFTDEDAELHLRPGFTVLLPGFAEGVLGLQKGATHQFSLDIPATYPQRHLAGKPCAFTVAVQDIKEERLPELNDDFAHQAGEGFPSLEALRERLEADLRQRKEAVAQEEQRDKAVDALLAAARTVEFPPVLVEREIDRLLQEETQMASRGGDVDRYVQQLGKSPQERQEELRPVAVERVRRSLVLTRLAEVENISVEPAEIDGEIERMAGGAGAQGTEVRRLFASRDGQDAIQRSLLTRKTLDRLTDIASQAEVPKPTRRRQISAVKAGGG
jgi:trigger factor